MNSALGTSSSRTVDHFATIRSALPKKIRKMMANMASIDTIGKIGWSRPNRVGPMVLVSSLRVAKPKIIGAMRTVPIEVSMSEMGTCTSYPEAKTSIQAGRPQPRRRS